MFSVSGIIKGDEIMVINGAIVSDLDMMYLESVLQEELSLVMMMRYFHFSLFDFYVNSNPRNVNRVNSCSLIKRPSPFEFVYIELEYSLQQKENCEYFLFARCFT